MEWPLNWEPVVLEAKQALEAELKRQVGRGHPLYSVSAEAIARRHDCDDVLFTMIGSSSVAVVHLSYGKEIDPLCPYTQVFGSLHDWAEQAKGTEHP